MLIQEVAGGEITSDVIDIYPKKIEDFTVFLHFEKAFKLIGQELPKETILQIYLNESPYGGTIYGVEVFMSQNLVYLDTATDEYNSLMFHKDAWAIAMQMSPRTQAQYKQEHLGWLVTVDVLYGHTSLRSNFGYVIKH